MICETKLNETVNPVNGSNCIFRLTKTEFPVMEMRRYDEPARKIWLLSPSYFLLFKFLP